MEIQDWNPKLGGRSRRIRFLFIGDDDDPWQGYLWPNQYIYILYMMGWGAGMCPKWLATLVYMSNSWVWLGQGLVSVPCWRFWTSSSSIHRRLYPQLLGDFQLGHLPTSVGVCIYSQVGLYTSTHTQLQSIILYLFMVFFYVLPMCALTCAWLQVVVGFLPLFCPVVLTSRGADGCGESVERWILKQIVMDIGFWLHPPD